MIGISHHTTDGRTVRRTDRQTHRQTDGRTDRRTDRQTHTHGHTHTQASRDTPRRRRRHRSNTLDPWAGRSLCLGRGVPGPENPLDLVSTEVASNKCPAGLYRGRVVQGRAYKGRAGQGRAGQGTCSAGDVHTGEMQYRDVQYRGRAVQRRAVQGARTGDVPKPSTARLDSTAGLYSMSPAGHGPSNSACPAGLHAHQSPAPHGLLGLGFLLI